MSMERIREGLVPMVAMSLASLTRMIQARVMYGGPFLVISFQYLDFVPFFLLYVRRTLRFLDPNIYTSIVIPFGLWTV